MRLFRKIKAKAKNIFTTGMHKIREGLDDNPFARTIRKIGYAFIDGSSDEFQTPLFDLQEIEDAYNTDSYVRQAMDKYSELMFKSDWEIVANDEQVHEYINYRIMAMSDAMGIPFDQFLRNCADDLVKFSNVFIVKARQDPSDFPSHINPQGLADQNPVAAYFRLPPQSMEILVDDHGTIQRYRQLSDGGDEVEFRPEDIIHIDYKKPAGRFFGIPMSLPALDDVRLLREVEDNIARMIHKHLYPLFLYKVGTDKPGYEATDPEIEQARDEIRDMPNEGGLVLPERHDVDMLKQEPLDALGYLEYYEKRTFTGLGVTQTLMGRGATSNKSTAENQSSELRDKVRSYQRVKEEAINYYIIRELLLEGGYDPILNSDHKAKFVFNEIDTDLKIKQENHSIYKFEHNAITHEEMREELNKDPVSDEERLNGNMFTDTNTEETDNKENPKNQHSEKNIPNTLISKLSSINLDLRNQILDVVSYYQKEILTKEEVRNSFELIINKKKKAIRSSFDKYLKNEFEKAVTEESSCVNFKNTSSKYCKSYKSQLQSLAEDKNSEYCEFFKSKLNQLLEKTKDKEKAYQNSAFLSIANYLESKMFQMVRNLISESYRYGKKFNNIREEE